MEAKNNLVCTKQSVDNLVKIVEMSLRMASPLLIEDIQETLDPVLEPLLLKQFNIQGKRKMVKIGDSGEIEVDPAFKLFFVSKLSNPHFLPEIFIRFFSLFSHFLQGDSHKFYSHWGRTRRAIANWGRKARNAWRRTDEAAAGAWNSHE